MVKWITHGSWFRGTVILNTLILIIYFPLVEICIHCLRPVVLLKIVMLSGKVFFSPVCIGKSTLHSTSVLLWHYVIKLELTHTGVNEKSKFFFPTCWQQLWWMVCLSSDLFQNISVHDPSYTQFTSLEELYAPSTLVFMLGFPHYGSQGEVSYQILMRLYLSVDWKSVYWMWGYLNEVLMP